MIRLLATSLILITFSFSAYAGEGDTLCRIVEAHTARADVAYQPGVDVNGNPVAPADLNAPSYLPEAIHIPVTIDMVRNNEIDLPAGTELNADLGVLEVRRNGRVFFNGQDITGQLQGTCFETIEPAAADAGPVVITVDEAERAMPAKDEIIWGQDN